VRGCSHQRFIECIGTPAQQPARLDIVSAAIVTHTAIATGNVVHPIIANRSFQHVDLLGAAVEHRSNGNCCLNLKLNLDLSEEPMSSVEGEGRILSARRSRERHNPQAPSVNPPRRNAGGLQAGDPILQVPADTPPPGAPRSLWRPERPSSTSVILYLTVTLAVIVGCLSTLRLFVGAGFAYLIVASVIIAIWVPFAFRWARTPWVAGLFASVGVQTWLVLRWAAENTKAILTPATPTAPLGSVVPTLPVGTVPKLTVEALPRITTAVHRFGTLPPLKLPGDHVSFAVAGKLVRDSLLQVNAIVAPAPMLVGFGIVVAIVAWIVGTLTEVFLGSFRARFEALLPMSVAAIASALLISHTTDPHRIRWVAAVGAACALHVVAVAALERRNLGNWFAGSKPRALRSGLVALTTLGIIGAMSIRIVERLNVDRRESAIDWRVSQQETPAGPTSITSPLASMQRQLLQQSNLEQFRVKALADGVPLASYWRQTSLSKFAPGEEWKGSGSYRRVKPADKLFATPDSDGVVLEQEMEIGALPNDQLPLAWEAQSVKVLRSIDPSLNTNPGDTPAGSSTGSATADDGITVPGQGDGVTATASTTSPPTSSAVVASSGVIPPKPTLSFDEQSLTLLAAKHPRPGQRYSVRSVVRRRIPDEVANAVVVADPADPELQLPALPERIKALAERITVSQTSTAAKAKAIQDYLRENYTYSLEVPENVVASPLDDFLFESKTGYCVQFAGAFTVLARSIGIPARLALGYTPGKLTEDGYFSVTGKNAHAWPEIRLADNRWVAFEPTPGRGNPDNEAITGIEGNDGSQSPDNTVATTTTTTTTIAPESAVVPTIPESTIPLADPPASNAKTSGWQGWLFALLVLLALAAAGALWWFRRRTEAAVIMTDRTRRALRSQEPAGQINALWDRVEQRMAKTVTPRASQETEIAFASRAQSVAPHITELALITQRARYGTASTVTEADAATAVGLAESIDAVLQAPPTQAP
jgi:transglutaminase-like putative cysteine protease